MKRFMTLLITGSLFATSLMSTQVARVAAQPSTQSQNKKYVALGDSIAAGLGLGSSDPTGCGRSTGAYAYQVAQARGLTLTHLACSGATAGDLVTRQHVSGPNPSAQLSTAFANGTPGLITITAGANDMRWGDFLRKCASADCGTAADTLATKALRVVLEQKLRYVFSDIQSRSGGKPPRVVITGYSNPISNYCKGRQPYVSNAEINWLNKERDELNKTIRKSMKGYNFVRYASTNFDGHTICAKQAWSQGLNDPAPLHPNTLGQQAIAKSVLSAAW